MSQIDSETIDVRAGEELDPTRLMSWLRDNLANLDGEITTRQFGGGHANLTYLISSENNVEYVLRRPPLGKVAKSAHDMAREHRVLKNLWRSFPLAPRSLLHCDDVDLIGAEFHIMQRKSGIGIRGEKEGSLLQDRLMAKRIGEMLIDTLAALHTCDINKAGLSELGNPEGFMQRQVEGWSRRWHNSIYADSPKADSLIDWIHKHRPPTQLIGLVHNDYKLDNLLVDATNPSVATAVLDWDMCTRGDVLSDLGTLLNYCVSENEPAMHRLAMGREPQFPGYSSHREMIHQYARLTGIDCQVLGWYRVFAAFRTATILQQIFIRWIQGQTRDQRFSKFDQRITALIAMAKSLCELHKIEIT
ncbi:MAG: aminoglycoside phosphotransferase (APT) family kinase protein [Gammaproteobacteria bacterium]|jgi:aminoglycoside phosphotransferase (APT) family kinase protein